MAVSFWESETKENLMRAFAGESQARNRYTFAAEQARAQGLHVVSKVFLFTASQEKEHAEIYYQHLKDLAGETIYIDGGYPIDLYEEVSQLLRAAQHNEYEEYAPVYKNFGDTAKEEGFLAAAHSFYRIAEIEKTHGDRFGMLADAMEQDALFKDATNQTTWVCLNCGYVHSGGSAPSVCPVCQHEQGYFYNSKFRLYTPSVMC